jgi:hypothetical protein
MWKLTELAGPEMERQSNPCGISSLQAQPQRLRDSYLQHIETLRGES